ncbi:MAG: hypothetical protein ACI857_002931 [Arenicella sp.]|jgi:hypothetical protein
MIRAIFITALCSIILIGCEKHEFVPIESSSAADFSTYPDGDSASGAQLNIPENGLRDGQYLFIEETSFHESQEEVYSLQGYKALSSYFTFKSNQSSLQQYAEFTIRESYLNLDFEHVNMYHIAGSKATITESILDTNNWKLMFYDDFDTTYGNTYFTSSILDLDNIYVIALDY